MFYHTSFVLSLWILSISILYGRLFVQYACPWEIMLQYVYRLWALRMSLNTDRIFPILNFKANTPYHTRENVSCPSGFLINNDLFLPIYLHFFHASGNEYFRYSNQASNMSELETEGQLLFGTSFWIGFGIILASCLVGGKLTCILGALLILFQPQCFSPRNCFQRAPV